MEAGRDSIEGSRGGDSVEREEGSKSSSSSTSGGRWWWRWRWINAARYVVALALTVVTMVVIMYAFKVELRKKEELVVTVWNGFVAVKPPPAKSLKPVSLGLTIEFFSPSDHGRRVSFTNVSLYLAAANESGMPNIFIYTDVSNITVQAPLFTFVSINVTFEHSLSHRWPVGDYYYYKLSSNLIGVGGGIIIPNAALRLGGTLWTETYLGYDVGRPVVYCCPGIAVGTAMAADFTNRPCTEQKASIEQQQDATLLYCEPIGAQHLPHF